MAYNPYNYPYYQYSPYNGSVEPSQRMQGQQTGITWVQGEAGARGFPVAPNTTVQLWDSDAQVIYLKSADASGMPSMKVLDYTIRDTQAKKPVDLSGYVTREELEARLAEIKGEEHGKSTV